MFSIRDRRFEKNSKPVADSPRQEGGGNQDFSCHSALDSDIASTGEKSMSKPTKNCFTLCVIMQTSTYSHQISARHDMALPTNQKKHDLVELLLNTIDIS
jgi:hypothetical protein